MLLEHRWKSLYSSGFIRHHFFSIMAYECTDFTTIEELTSCHWVESGVPEKHFIEILPMKKTNAESIYLFTFRGVLQGKEHSVGKA